MEAPVLTKVLTRLVIPVSIDRDPRKVLFRSFLSLWVGPFRSETDAETYFTEFVEAASLKWQELALERNSYILEMRTVRGPTIAKLAGGRQVEISVSTSAQNKHSPRIHYIIDEGQYDHPLSSEESLYHINPKVTSARELARDFHDFVREAVHAAIDI